MQRGSFVRLLWRVAEVVLIAVAIMLLVGHFSQAGGGHEDPVRFPFD